MFDEYVGLPSGWFWFKHITGSIFEVFSAVFLEEVVDGISASLQEEAFITDYIPTIINLLYLVLVDGLSKRMLCRVHQGTLRDVCNTRPHHLVHVGFTQREINLGTTLFRDVLLL